MARKTRKQSNTKKGIYSIPELRRAFEQVEQVLAEMIHSKETKAVMITRIQQEWRKVFHKTLDKASAGALIAHQMESRRGTRQKGGAAIAGAPLDDTMRPGIYLDQGQVPGPDGGLTKTVGGGYGSYVQYVSNGFFHPEIARNLDPVPGQSLFPMPRVDMGSNLVKGGKRRTRKSRGGYALIDQAFMRPIPNDVPPTSIAFDLQRTLQGVQGGVSPDQTQRLPSYQLGAVHPRAVNINV